MAWVAYRHQLWPGVRYGLGTITNDLKVTDNLLHKEDYRMLNILGVVCSITRVSGTCTHHLEVLACLISLWNN
jgi:hypothetical protein